MTNSKQAVVQNDVLKASERKSIQYGGSSQTLSHCPRCAQGVDGHPHANIRPTAQSEKGIEALSAYLDSQYYVAHKRRMEAGASRREFMIGALQAKVGGRVYRMVATSARNAIEADRIGGDWEVIKDFPLAVRDNGNRYDISGNIFEAKSTQKCAAQKLLCALFERTAGSSISSIEMSETWWRDSEDREESPNKKYAQYGAVESCSVCERVIPQMLCNASELDLVAFRPRAVPMRGSTQRPLTCPLGHQFDATVPDNLWRSFSTTRGYEWPCPVCGKPKLCRGR